MKTPTTLISAVPLAAAIAGSTLIAQSGTAKPPVAKKVPQTLTLLHGDERVDEYGWLRDKKAPRPSPFISRPRTRTRTR